MSLTVVICLSILGGAGICLNYSSTNQLLEQTLRETVKIASDKVANELTSYLNVAIDTGTIARLTDPQQSTGNKQLLIDDKVKQYGFQSGNIIGPDGISALDGKDPSLWSAKSTENCPLLWLLPYGRTDGLIQQSQAWYSLFRRVHF